MSVTFELRPAGCYTDSEATRPPPLSPLPGSKAGYQAPLSPSSTRSPLSPPSVPPWCKQLPPPSTPSTLTRTRTRKARGSPPHPPHTHTGFRAQGHRGLGLECLGLKGTGHQEVQGTGV